MRDDEIIRRIECFRFRHGPWRPSGGIRGTPWSMPAPAAPLARLRPCGRDDLMEIFYWSLWKQRWAPVGPFGQTIVSLDEALRIHRRRTNLLGGM